MKISTSLREKVCWTLAPNRYLSSKKSASKGGGQKTDFFILTAPLKSWRFSINRKFWKLENFFLDIYRVLHYFRPIADINFNVVYSRPSLHCQLWTEHLVSRFFHLDLHLQKTFPDQNSFYNLWNKTFFLQLSFQNCWLNLLGSISNNEMPKSKSIVDNINNNMRLWIFELIRLW